MEQDLNNLAQNSKKDKQKDNKTIIIGIAFIFGLLGIGFGVYGLLTNIKKDEQINKLQEQISQLQEKNNQLENASPQAINEKTRIKIISSSWSGSSKDYKPDETESYCEIELQKKCVIKTRQFSNSEGDEWEEEILSFKITNINTDSIGIHTFQVFSEGEGGINLRSDKQDFTIKLNESLRLTTPTTDYGDIFTITLSQD